MIAADATLGIALRNIRVHTVPFIRILIFYKYWRFNWRKSNSKVITENIINGSHI